MIPYDPFIDILRDVFLQGAEVGPRGMRTREVLNYTYRLPAFARFMSWPSRKLSVQYIKDEFLWYLRGDRTDLSIAEKAKVWKIAITNGQLNSNYGHYLFKQGGLKYMVECLVKDPATRRAVCPILAAEHLDVWTNDLPCTIAVGLMLRNGRLNCNVHMRSQDVIYGAGNDIPFFSFVQEMGLYLLREREWQNEALDTVILGDLTVTVDSLHIYERHFEMAEQIISGPEDLVPVDCPPMAGAHEVKFLLRAEGTAGIDTYPFIRWLNSK